MLHLFLPVLFVLTSTVLSFGQQEIPSTTNNDIVAVVIFLGVDCPISQKYIACLNSIYLTYKDNPRIQWSFIVPGKEKKNKIKAFEQEYRLQFPLQSDRDSQVTKYGASVTPEAFIVSHEQTVYKGAIDNWFYELGKYRSQVSENYLRDALEAILKNQEPFFKETTPVGCFIQTSLANTHQHDH